MTLNRHYFPGISRLGFEHQYNSWNWVLWWKRSHAIGITSSEADRSNLVNIHGFFPALILGVGVMSGTLSAIYLQFQPRCPPRSHNSWDAQACEERKCLMYCHASDILQACEERKYFQKNERSHVVMESSRNWLPQGSPFNGDPRSRFRTDSIENVSNMPEYMYIYIYIPIKPAKAG